jgi:hypothetical protein
MNASPSSANIPCHVPGATCLARKERAIKSFVILVRHKFTLHPELADPSSPRKRKQTDEYRDNTEKSRRTKGSQPAQSCLLGYCRLGFELQDPTGHSLSLPLRSIIEDCADLLEAYWTLNTAYVLHVRFSCFQLPIFTVKQQNIIRQVDHCTHGVHHAFLSK